MGKPRKDNEKFTRDKAAEARREAIAAQTRRERIVRIAAGATVVALVVGIIGIAMYASRSDSGTTNSASNAQEDVNAPLPKGVIPAGETSAYGFPVAATIKPDAPTLEVWEDFQCPACRTVEQLNGQGIKDLGTSGRANIILRPTTFLDINLGNDSSVKATAAWGCAIDQDKGLEYHSALFAAQPTEEGSGWDTATLINIGEETGISGANLDTFRSCVEAGTYRQWALNSTARFYDAEISGTPTGIVNGTQVISGQILGDPVELEKVLFAGQKAE